MEQLQTWWVTALYMPIDGDSCMEIPGDCEVAKAADAQAAIAALQARVQELEDDRSAWKEIAQDWSAAAKLAEQPEMKEGESCDMHEGENDPNNPKKEM